MDRRRALQTIGAIGGGIGLSGCLSSIPGMSSPVEGTVEGKSITGRKSDTNYGIVLAHREYLSVDDETFEDEFPNWQAVTVDAELEQQLQFEYIDLHYNVHVAHASENQHHDVQESGSLAYRVDRELFNAVSVTDDITFEAAATELPRIRRFTDISGE